MSVTSVMTNGLRTGTVLIFALGLFVGCDGMNRADAVRKMNDGLEEHQLGRNVDAIRSLKEAAQLDPTYAEPSYYLGQIYHVKLSQFDDAERAYREAYDRDKDNAQIAYRLGAVLSDSGKWAEAEPFFDEAVKNEEGFAKAWFRLGLALERQEKYVEAVEAFGSSIKSNARMRMDKTDAGGAAYHALGDLYIRFKLYDKALAVYKNGIENNDISGLPQRPGQLFSGQGVALLKLEKFSEAKDSFKKALEIDPSATTAVFNLAVAQMAMKETADAIKGFEAFTSRADPARDEARILAAQGFIQQIEAAAERNKEEEKK